MYPACIRMHAVVSELKRFCLWTRRPRRDFPNASSSSGAGSAALPASFSSELPSGLLLGLLLQRHHCSEQGVHRVWTNSSGLLLFHFLLISQEVMRQFRSVTGEGWDIISIAAVCASVCYTACSAAHFLSGGVECGESYTL